MFLSETSGKRSPGLLTISSKNLKSVSNKTSLLPRRLWPPPCKRLGFYSATLWPMLTKRLTICTIVWKAVAILFLLVHLPEIAPILPEILKYFWSFSTMQNEYLSGICRRKLRHLPDRCKILLQDSVGTHIEAKRKPVRTKPYFLPGGYQNSMRTKPDLV